MAKIGRPFAIWQDWKGRIGTTYQMCAWHNATRAALYKRAKKREGIWYLAPPKRAVCASEDRA